MSACERLVCCGELKLAEVRSECSELILIVHKMSQSREGLRLLLPLQGACVIASFQDYYLALTTPSSACFCFFLFASNQDGRT